MFTLAINLEVIVSRSPKGLCSPKVILTWIESERIFQYEIVIEAVLVIKCVDKGIYIQKRKKSEGE